MIPRRRPIAWGRLKGRVVLDIECGPASPVPDALHQRIMMSLIPWDRAAMNSSLVSISWSRRIFVMGHHTVAINIARVRWERRGRRPGQETSEIKSVEARGPSFRYILFYRGRGCNPNAPILFIVDNWSECVRQYKCTKQRVVSIFTTWRKIPGRRTGYLRAVPW